MKGREKAGRWVGEEEGEKEGVMQVRREARDGVGRERGGGGLKGQYRNEEGSERQRE